MNFCLACNLALNGEAQYHQKCLKDFWKEDKPVLSLNLDLANIKELARENISQRIIVTGVQPKLSLGYIEEKKEKRLTIVGALNGKYILKPPFDLYPQMPEIEALSMLMAKEAGIETVPFLLIPLLGGELAYLTKRIDRSPTNKKFPMEDACQFTGRLTEHKYRGSYEQIAKAIINFSHNPLLEVVKFYQQVIVSFLIGNNDMHFKNFSLIAFKNGKYQLSPAYDMISTSLLIKDDPEELALNLNGKKRKLSREDFNSAMSKSSIPAKAIENLWGRVESGVQSWSEIIDKSFLTKNTKLEFSYLIQERAGRLGLKL